MTRRRVPCPGGDGPGQGRLGSRVGRNLRYRSEGRRLSGRRGLRWRMVGTVAMAAAAVVPVGSGLVGATSAGASSGGSLTYAGFGGTTQDNEDAVFLDPFARANGLTVYNATVTYGQLYSMVKAHHVTWDVANTDAWFANKACARGYATPLSAQVLAAIKKVDLPSDDWGRCWVSPWSYSTVLAWSTSLRPTPTSWSSFYDPSIAGKRSMYSYLVDGQYETALSATGLAPTKIYPLDLTKATKELSKIKGDLLYSEDLETQVQQLASGEAVMGAVTSSRVQTAVDNGQPVAFTWHNQFLSTDPLMVPKGAPNTKGAMAFLASLLNNRKLLRFAKVNGYGPNTPGGQALLQKSSFCGKVNTCPSNEAGAIKIDNAWYTANITKAQDVWNSFTGSGQ